MRELAIIMREIGSLRRIYRKYTAMHENIWTLHLILCMSIAIVGGNKMQMCESHAQCVRVGRSALYFCIRRVVNFWCLPLGPAHWQKRKKAKVIFETKPTSR